MRFRQWLRMDEARFKGLQRQYRQQNPGAPAYVVNQMYNAMVAPGMRRALAPWLPDPKETMAQPQSHKPDAKAQTSPPASAPSATTDYPPATTDPNSTAYFTPTGSDPAETGYYPPQGTETQQDPGPVPPDLASSVLKNKDAIRGAIFSKKPQTITLMPWMLEPATLARLRHVRFGLTPHDDEVRNDSRRHALQLQLAGERTNADNEPVVLIREPDGKYELIDGYHRLSGYFLRSAPPEDIGPMRSGDFSNIDFRRWKPITVKAYVGVRPGTPNPYIAGPSNPPPYTPMPDPQTTIYQEPPQAA